MDIKTKGTKGDFEMKINLSREEAKWVADEINNALPDDDQRRPR